MSKNTSITLSDYFEVIIHNGIKSGRYSSTSEVIRAGLRLIDEEEKKIQLLKEAIEAGENSGYAKNFNPEEHLTELNRKFGK